MTKFEKWYNSLDYDNFCINNRGEGGYFVTLGELLDNGGKNEFFHTTTNGKQGLKVGKKVYYRPEYDRTEKAYFADNYEDSCETSKRLTRKSLIFIGFTY